MTKLHLPFISLLQRWFPAHSVRTQLSVMLFGLSAISIAVVSYLGVNFLAESGQKAEQITSAAMEQRARQFLEETAASAAEKNGIIFRNIQLASNNATTFAAQVLDNPGNFAASGWNYDANIAPAPGGGGMNGAGDTSSVYMPPSVKVTPAVKRQMELTAYLDHLFPSILKNEANAVAIYYIGPQGETRYYPNIGLGSVVPAAYTPIGDVFYTPITPENDPSKTVQWSKVYNDPANNGLLVTASNPIYTRAGFGGMVGIDVTLNEVAKNIAAYTPIESSYAFLMNNDGRAIALPDKGYKDILKRGPKAGEFGVDLSATKGSFTPMLNLMKNGHHGFGVIKLAGDNLDVAYQPVPGTSFSLAIVARESSLLKVVAQLRAQVKNSTHDMIYYRILPIGLLLLLFSCACGFFYIRQLSEPLKQLTAKTALISRGNLDIEPAKVSMNNEIGTLASSFNAMVGDLKQAKSKIYDQNEALQREQSRLRASIRSLSFGFAIISPDDEIVFHNNVLAKLFRHDIPDEPAASKSTLEAVSEDFKASIDLLGCIRECLAKHKSIQKNVEIGPRFYRFLFAPILDDTVKDKRIAHAIGVVLVMEDTTDAKAMERSRDEFFSIASHELRTPLTAIQGNAGMIMQYYKEHLQDPVMKEMVTDIHESSVRLITIVNDFLDTSRLEQGKMVFKPADFDIQKTIEKVLREFDVSGSRNKLYLKLERMEGDPPIVHADEDRFRQVLINLVSNGIKFTEKGGITVSVQLTNPKTVKVSVVDTGKGVPLESQHLLFRKFQQASNNILTRDNTRSTGLGLYISGLIIKSMKGRLYLDWTEVGKGSCFSLELPLASKRAGNKS